MHIYKNIFTCIHTYAQTHKYMYVYKQAMSLSSDKQTHKNPQPFGSLVKLGEES